jgi:hypothetical protein
MKLLLILVLVSSLSLAQKVMLSPRGESGRLTTAVIAVFHADALKAAGFEVVTVDWGMYSRGLVYNDTNPRDLREIQDAFSRTSTEYAVLVNLVTSKETNRLCLLFACRFAFQTVISLVITDGQGKVLDRFELTGSGEAPNADEALNASATSVATEVAKRLREKVAR